MKTFVLFIALIVVFIAVAVGYNRYTQPGPVGGPFELTDSNGKVVTEKDIRAKPAVVFFGYTMCPDVCPTTLMDMQRWLTELGPDADKLGVWFFTVDPEHDTPQVMHDYLSNFSDKIIGISGDPKKVHDVVKSFNIVAIKVPGAGGEYTYDHTAAVILLRKGGKAAGIIPYIPDVGSASERDGIAMDKLKNLIQKPN